MGHGAWSMAHGASGLEQDGAGYEIWRQKNDLFLYPEN